MQEARQTSGREQAPPTVEKHLKTVVVIPCFNEELTVGRVLQSFKRILPSAELYVFDNNSTDGTAAVAKSHGAMVVREKRRGKGFVMQAMFQKVAADVYVMVDGDDTYDVSNVLDAVRMIAEDEADMVAGNRVAFSGAKAFRPFHTFGNKLVRWLINKLFRADLKDIMTGYRIMSHSFVKGINITSGGFEVETEIDRKSGV